MLTNFSSRCPSSPDSYLVRYGQSNNFDQLDPLSEEDKEVVIDLAEDGGSAKVIAEELGLTIAEFSFKLKADEEFNEAYKEILVGRQQARQAREAEDHKICDANHSRVLDLDQLNGNEFLLCRELKIKYTSLVGYIYKHVFSSRVADILKEDLNDKVICRLAEDMKLSAVMFNSCLRYNPETYKLYRQAKQEKATSKTKVEEQLNLPHLDYPILNDEDGYNRVWQMVSDKAEDEEIAKKFGLPVEAISSLIEETPALKSLRRRNQKSSQRLKLKAGHPEIHKRLDNRRPVAQIVA